MAFEPDTSLPENSLENLSIMPDILEETMLQLILEGKFSKKSMLYHLRVNTLIFSPASLFQQERGGRACDG